MFVRGDFPIVMRQFVVEVVAFAIQGDEDREIFAVID
jgi:hypothetical protein